MKYYKVNNILEIDVSSVLSLQFRISVQKCVETEKP